MKNFLIVVPPFLGHITNALGIGKSLKQRGHQIFFATGSSYRHTIERSKFKFIELDIDDDPYKDLKKSCQPLLELINRYSINLIINDVSLYRPVLAAERCGIPSVSFDPTCPLPDHVYYEQNPLRKSIFSMLHKILNLQREKLNLPPLDDQRPSRLELSGASKHLHLVMVVPDLVYEGSPLPESSIVVGPSMDDPIEIRSFGQGEAPNRDRRTIVVSTSSSNQPQIIKDTQKYLSSTQTAFGHSDKMNLIYTLHSFYHMDTITANTKIDYDLFSHHKYFPHTDLLISPGGINTIQKAMKYSIPVLIFPSGFGSVYIGKQCELIGCGKLVQHNVSIDELTEVVEKMISSPQMKKKCTEQAQKIADLRTEERCADLIESIL